MAEFNREELVEDVKLLGDKLGSAFAPLILIWVVCLIIFVVVGFHFGRVWGLVGAAALYVGVSVMQAGIVFLNFVFIENKKGS